MTHAEVRSVVERVVVEHGQGWLVEMHGSKRKPIIAAGPVDGSAGVYVYREGDKLTGYWVANPTIRNVEGDRYVASAVALWPEMQRLVQMLREALK